MAPLAQMAFTDLELQEIEQVIGSFCKKRSPERFAGIIWLAYKIENHDITIYESRPYWQDQTRQIETPFAKIKYVRTQNRWQLFWQRASGKWQQYEPFFKNQSLVKLVEMIDRDEYGCFLG